MIYKTYNFVDSYSNADGSQKSSMVLGELSKVIRNQPKAVISALKDAGIALPKNVTRKQLTRLIITNKRNRKMSENLAILITANVTPSNGMIPKGVEKFDNLVDPNGGNGKYYYNTNGDEPLPTLSGSAGLQGLAKGTEQLAGTEREKGNWFETITKIFQGGKTKQADAGTTDADKQRLKRFGDWFNKNRDTIGQVGSTIYGSLQANGKIPTTGGDGGGGGNDNDLPAATWFERNKNAVLIGGVIALGAIAYFATRKGKKGGKK
jgi:hypothetical protein